MAQANNLIVINTTNSAYAAQWLCDNLFFEIELRQGTALYVKTGSLRIKLEQMQQPKSAAQIYGVDHIALRCGDIAEALVYCKSRNMDLDLCDGGYYHNPQIWEQGTHYFNLVAPFGLKFEISQRLAQPIHCGKVIEGLCHIGLCVADFEQAVARLELLGFSQDYPAFVNVVGDNRVHCKTMAQSGMTFEVFHHSQQRFASADIRPFINRFEVAGERPQHGSLPTGETVLVMEG